MEPGTVLNLGCGGGRESFALQRLEFRPTGVDISEAELHSARGSAAELGQRTPFLRYDGVALP